MLIKYDFVAARIDVWVNGHCIACVRSTNIMLKSQYHSARMAYYARHTNTLYIWLLIPWKEPPYSHRVCVYYGDIFACDIAIYAQMPIITCK